MELHKQISYFCSRCRKNVIQSGEFNGRCGCGQEIRRYHITYGAKPQEVERCGVDVLHKENIRYSDALGINPGQEKEFKEKWPWMNFLPDGRCIIHSRFEKKRIMKARGFWD